MISPDHEKSARDRILAATAEVLARSGQSKLSLSEVAVQAGVSRPTLYRWFASKEDLLEAFSAFEHSCFNDGINGATSGLCGNEKLEAALRFIVDYQRSYSGVRIIDLEPAGAIQRLSRVIPLMRSQLQRLLPGPDSAIKAAAVVRVVVSHYVVASDDANQLLAQLHYTVGIKG